MGRLREYARWTWALLVAAATIAISIALYGHRRFKEGAAIGEAEEGAAKDIERVREAEARKDDEAVLDEWRKHNK